MPNITGACLCGNVRFHTQAEPEFIGNCHCDDCRKSSGSVYATYVFMQKEDVHLTGQTHSYSHVVPSGNVLTKHFCPNCGSQIFHVGQRRPTWIGLRAGCIHEHVHVKPQINLFAGHKVTSTPLDPVLPAPAGMPES